MPMTHWSYGDQILLRTVLEDEKVGTVLPVTVVQDDTFVALYLAPGTRCKRRAGVKGGPRNRVTITPFDHHDDWTWTRHQRLTLWRPEEMFAVSLFWREADGTFLEWYVDVLLPFRRSPRGFLTRYLNLDAVISADGRWRLKDDDEIEWMEVHGLLSREQAQSIRSAAERAVDLFAVGDPLFSDTWRDWRADPAWKVPAIPQGWNIL